ncbi:MAG TPA: hypothetical protein PKI03_27340 [Pseudomonadota bacterium]|nr:hypothetical protein [Pseudomonadota bacterium]
MSLKLVVLALAFALLVYAVVRRAGFYRRFFSDPHLREVASALPALRRTGLDQLAATNPVEPRPVVSSLGLVILYTVRNNGEEGGFVHHLSVSLGGGYTPHAVGAYFLIFALRGLGVDPRQVGLGMSPSHIFHCEWTLSPTEEAEFAGREVPVIADVRAAWQECVQLRAQIRFDRTPAAG